MKNKTLGHLFIAGAAGCLGAHFLTKKTVGDLFLTGATGWLGAHVLDEFLSSERGIAYCLVRGTNFADSHNKLKATLNNYFGNKYANCSRIVVVCGDIAKKITTDKPINTIIHCAANVKHYGSYQHSHAVNVIGTENVIALAKEKNARLLHISTASVSGNSFEQSPDFPPTVFDETKLYIGQPLENVYIRSKFESEAVVLQAKLDGLDAAVVRVGNLSNRRSDLKFQKNHNENATLTRLKAFVDLGIYPEEMADFPIEFSPVDDTAKAIITLAWHMDESHSVYHAYNHKHFRFKDFVRVLLAADADMRPMPIGQFVEAVQNATSNIREAFINDIDADGKLRFGSNITVSNDFTSWYLSRVGFDWSEVDVGYLAQYVEYFHGIGYWRCN